MKKFSIIGLLILLLATLAVSANAALVSTTTFSSTSPVFGGKSAEASNPDEDFDSIVTGQVTFTNTDPAISVTVDKINVISESGFTVQDLKINLTGPVTFPANETKTVSFTARIPQDLDAVNDNLEPVAFKVATVQLLSGTTNLASFDAFMQRGNELVISDAHISINGDRESLDDGKSVKDIKPGDSIEVELELKNEFSSRKQINVDMRDIKARVQIDQSGLSIDEDQDVDDISADDKDTVTLNFDIDEDADENDYDTFITVDGRDEHGARHGEQWKVTLEVKRNDHDVQIKRVQVVDVTPPVLTCGEDVRFVVLTQNEGRKDEKNVFVTVKQTELGLDLRSDPFDVRKFDQRDNDFTVTLTGTVPKDALKGNYIAEVKTLFNGGKDENSDFAQFSLGECVTTPKVGKVSLQLQQTTFTVSQGKVFAVPVTLQNTGSETTTYTVEVKPDTNWADTPSEQDVTLDVAESSTVYAYLTPSVASGSYTATVSVKQDGAVLKTSKVNVNLGGAPGTTGGVTYEPSVTFSSVWRNLAGSTAFWIAAIIVIVALIIWILTVLIRPK